MPGADFTIVFDGGAIGNPGRGYGSYQIVGREGLVAQERLEYGDRVTNNQAEYRTLVEALEDLRDRLGRDATRSSIAVRGDSQLVIQQVTGRWKVKHPELQPLRAQVVDLLRGFARSDVAWHRRDASVRLLGH
ncbi:MAG: ribonuclease HI family protein [Chloroflexota bacterium]|nr:ribonuclease HI family protein [Chloroflexota bacterium]